MVPHLTRFEPLRVMAIFGTYLRAGRGSEPVWFREVQKLHQKFRSYMGPPSSGGPNPKLTMTLKKLAPPLNVKQSMKLKLKEIKFKHPLSTQLLLLLNSESDGVFHWIINNASHFRRDSHVQSAIKAA